MRWRISSKELRFVKRLSSHQVAPAPANGATILFPLVVLSPGVMPILTISKGVSADLCSLI